MTPEQREAEISEIFPHVCRFCGHSYGTEQGWVDHLFETHYRADPHVYGALLQAEKDLAEARREALALRAALERFADLGQLVLDRITNGVTNEERFLMKDTARIAMERYHSLGTRPTHGADAGEANDGE